MKYNNDNNERDNRSNKMNVDPELTKKRIAVLLSINNHLLRKAHQLSQTPNSNESLQNCLRRAHCNLSVLATISELNGQSLLNSSSSKIEYPQILTPPGDMPELNELYLQLQQLYPEAYQLLQKKALMMRKMNTGTANTPIQSNNNANNGGGTNSNGFASISPQQILSQNPQMMMNQMGQNMNVNMNSNVNVNMNSNMNQNMNQNMGPNMNNSMMEGMW